MEEDRPKTAFCPGPGLGLFQFCRMPFGLTGAPSAFQRLMDKVFQGLPFVTTYLDDVLVHTSSERPRGSSPSGIPMPCYCRFDTTWYKVSHWHGAGLLFGPCFFCQRNGTRPKESCSCSQLADTDRCQWSSEIPRTCFLLPTVHQGLCRCSCAIAPFAVKGSRIHLGHCLPGSI